MRIGVDKHPQRSSQFDWLPWYHFIVAFMGIFSRYQRPEENNGAGTFDVVRVYRYLKYSEIVLGFGIVPISSWILV